MFQGCSDSLQQDVHGVDFGIIGHVICTKYKEELEISFGGGDTHEEVCGRYRRSSMYKMLVLLFW